MSGNAVIVKSFTWFHKQTFCVRHFRATGFSAAAAGGSYFSKILSSNEVIVIFFTYFPKQCWCEIKLVREKEFSAAAAGGILFSQNG